MFFSAVKLGILTWGVYGIDSLLQPASSGVDELQFKSLPCWFQEREWEVAAWLGRMSERERWCVWDAHPDDAQILEVVCPGLGLRHTSRHNHLLILLLRFPETQHTVSISPAERLFRGRYPHL